MNKNPIVKDVLSYIEENLQEELSLDSIAGKLNYNKCYMNRLFAKSVGCTIYQYIRSRRLTEAAQQLAETEIPIVEIAQEAHYDSQQAFTQAFRQLYLISPQAYRQRGEFVPRQPRVYLKHTSCKLQSRYTGCFRPFNERAVITAGGRRAA